MNLRLSAPAPSLALLACAALVAACPPPREVDQGEGEGEGEEEECLTATLGPVTFNFQDDVSTHFEAELTTNLDTQVGDYLVLQLFNYNERIGDLGVGTFPLDDAINDNYGHCAECILVFTDQIDEQAVPSRVFFQSEGSITLARNPREDLDLIGSIDDLVLVESTIGGDALESAPVPGGDCLVIGDVALDLKYVPEGWTCAPALFHAGDGVCDCACGAPDTDCFPNFDDPPPTSTVGCTENQICVYEGCRDTCDAFAGIECPAATDVCAFAEPSDYCVSAAALADPANIGDECEQNDFAQKWCAVTATIPAGVCDYDLDGDGVRTCRARCASNADCATDEECIGVAYAEDGSVRGYCDAPPP